MTETHNHPNGAQTRPSSSARKVGTRKRMRFTKSLRDAAKWSLDKVGYRNALSNVTGADPLWVVSRVRPEVLAVAEVFQQLHLKNTGKELSKAEAISALVLAGMPRLLGHEDFAIER